MKDYKKTYWPLALWCAALVPVMLGVSLPAERAGVDERGMVALMMTVVVLMLIGLMWIILRGEYVYWINGGPSFEEAKATGSEARREFARKHLVAMLKGGAAAIALTAAEYALGAHELAIVLSVSVCIIAAVIPMIGIKWTVSKGDTENR